MSMKTSMSAIVCAQYGQPHDLRLATVQTPVLADNEVRIQVAVAGINFPDSLIIKGEYQVKPPLPFTPGFEVTGKVIETGPTVTNIAVGQRVMALASKGYGAFAEEVAANAHEVVPIPNGLDYHSAAALFVAYGTAFHALVQRANLQAGETLVVLGASGGVGLAAVELGKALGANVIAVCRTHQRALPAQTKGADHVIAYDDEDIRNGVLQATDGRGADVCIDMLGGQAFHAMSRSMNWGGRLLIVGFTSGEIPQLSMNLPLLKGYQVIGVYWGQFLARSPDLNEQNFRALATLIDTGKITPHIAGRYPLTRVPDALTALLSREVAGKLLIDVTGQQEVMHAS
ncbi:NADPH:quinone oxidoreductase family protein [Pseudomonas sp. BN607]|uniref:NADPH:quinone oxidoreductase family protein n=1 Tax=Pseudomonas sp. BN607 TaxID=2567895 RepID=UPI002458D491|nr:NADPH:quinone oxidoreductase family protein [Pseudomonas sp. BN607]